MNIPPALRAGFSLVALSSRHSQERYEHRSLRGISMRLGKQLAGLALAMALACVAYAIPQDSPKQDMKDAGHSTKNAAKDTGRATNNTARTTGHKTKTTSKKAAHKSATKTRHGAAKVEQKTQP
jgi:hypothetical protein